MTKLYHMALIQQAIANATPSRVAYRLAASAWADAGVPRKAVRCHRIANSLPPRGTA